MQDVSSFWMRRAAVWLRAPLGCLSARRVPRAAAERTLVYLPLDAPERVAWAAATADASMKAQAATQKVVTFLNERSPEHEHCLPLMRRKGYKARMVQLEGGAPLLEERVVAAAELNGVRQSATKVALDDYAARLRRVGEAELLRHKGLQAAMVTVEEWRPMDETQAVAFGLGRSDQTLRWRALQTLPRMLQVFVVELGLVSVLPETLLPGPGFGGAVYLHVHGALAKACVLQCEACGACSELPRKAAELEAPCCGECEAGSVPMRLACTGEFRALDEPPVDGLVHEYTEGDLYAIWDWYVGESVVGGVRSRMVRVREAEAGGGSLVPWVDDVDAPVLCESSQEIV